MAIAGLPPRPLHAVRPAGVTPLGLPVLFADPDARDATRRALIAERIYCAQHWPSPPPVTAERFPTAVDGAARILTLPCDQRYDEADMARLAAALREALA